MTRRAYLYFILTFVIGIAVGGAGTYYYAWSSGKWRRSFSEDKLVHRMTRDLNLSAPQVKDLRSVLDDEIAKLKALNAATKPQFDSVHHHALDEIRGILNPQQTAKFNRLLREHERARQKK
jgi:hypothetical protein